MIQHLGELLPIFLCDVFLPVFLDFYKCKEKKRYTKSFQSVKTKITILLGNQAGKWILLWVRLCYLELQGVAFLKNQEYSKFSEDLINRQFGMIGHFCTNTYFHSGKVDRSLPYLIQTGYVSWWCSKQHAKTTEQDI